MTFHQYPTMYPKACTLNVKDLSKSIEFYEDVLGFVLHEEKDRSVMLGTEKVKDLLTLVETEAMKENKKRMVGLYHVALLLPGRKDLALFVKHLDELGITFSAGDHLVSEAIYFSDPDGHGIEVYADRPASSWEWRGKEVVMNTLPVDFASLLSLPSEGEKWHQLPEGTVLGHLHFQVKNLEEHQRFYREGLGYDLVSQLGQEAMFLSDSDYHHHIAFNTWANFYLEAEKDRDVGMRTFHLAVASRERQEEIGTRLKQLGYTVDREGDTLVTYDPANIEVRLTLDEKE